MTPRDKLHVMLVDKETPNAKAFMDLMHEKRVEKIPIVNNKDEILGLVTLKDAMRMTERPNANLDSRG
jgi:IMP dehydrogenase